MSQAVSRLESLKTLRNANLDGAFATAFATLVGGTFMVGFVKLLGGSDLWIGVLTAIPSLLGILQIPGAIWGRSQPGYKKFVTPGGVLWRLFYLPVIALPLLAISADSKLWIFAACVTVAAACVLIVSPIYNDWLAEMVPESSRGWFFSRRNAILAAVGTGVGTLGGLLLDGMRHLNRPKEGFALVFLVGLICSAISLVFYFRMKDLPRPNPAPPHFREAIRAFRMPLADRKFRVVLIFFIAFVFAQTFPGNLFGAYALESLGLPFTLIQICGAAQAIGSIIFGKWWGYLADKYGNRPLLLLLGMGIALTPVCWQLTRPDDLVWNATILLIGHVYSGAMWGGVAVCQFNLLLATSNPKDRATYLGLGMAVQAIVGGIAPLVGAQFMASVRAATDPWTAYHAIFWATMGLRFVASFFLLPVKEEGSVGIRQTIQRLRRISPGGVAALQRLSKSTHPEAREEAIQAVASRGFTLASEEVIQALHDPSPRVRRQAATALARMGEERAVRALIHQLEDHPDLVEEETIDALGDLGALEAVESLTPFLHSPRSSVRRATAKALGRMGATSAIPALMKSAEEAGDADLRRASLQALRMLGATEATDVICRSLYDSYPSVRIAAAEAVADLNLTEAAEHLRNSLRSFEDEAESEVAYSLGCVGSLDDIPLILDEATKCVSITTRRRALLGVARLLGVERDVYPLFMDEGLSRDAALMELLRPASKRFPRVRLALEKYSAGDEPAALQVLAQAKLDPRFQLLTGIPVDELFLVAAAVVRKLEQENG